MKVIITFTFCYDNLWKSKFVALEKPGKLGIFFLLLCGYLSGALSQRGLNPTKLAYNPSRPDGQLR